MAVATSSQSGISNKVPLVPNSGRELLLDLKRSTARNALGGGNDKNSIPTLPPYNHKLVQACFRDLHGTARELELKARIYGNNNNKNDDGGGSSSKPSMSARPSILLHNIAVQRNKRCLLAYHHHRMEIIKSIQRAKGLENNHSMLDDAGSPPISTNAQEVAFARDYATLREAYSSKVFELDLLPPTSHMLQVRVLKEVGQVVLPDSGKVVTMSKGACLFMDRADAKDFLKQGILQLYDGEEVDF